MISALQWACVSASLVAPLMALHVPAGRSLSQAGSGACGSLNSPCCSGDDDADSCPAGWDAAATQTLACSGQTCVPCGGPGEACCQRYSLRDPDCDDGSVCASGTCKACGDEGLPCCAGDDNNNIALCPVGNLASDGLFLRCDGVQGNGTCEKCGGVNEPCCQRRSYSDPSCDDGSVCASGTCKACGTEGLPCCAGDANIELCPVGNKDSNMLFLRCDGVQANGTCEKCGGVNEPCCQRRSYSDPSCDDGYTCGSGTCTACGEAGLPCCPGRGAIVNCPAGEDAAQTLVCDSDEGNGTCIECGKAQQSCCQRYLTSDPECESGLNCAGAGGVGLGQCEACGGLGQPCCDSASDDDPCQAGGLCSGGTCVACGGLEQPCCPHDKNDIWRMCSYAGHAMCLAGKCTACGRPGEPCCTGDGNGRITGSGTDAEDSVCWSGAACPDSRTCPPDPIPAASAADQGFCAASNAEFGIYKGIHFDACVGAAANTKCEDTVLAGPAGSRIVPDWCLDFSGNRSAPAFDCPAAAATGPPKYVYCSETSRATECGNTFCEGGDVECDAWSPRDVTATRLFTLQPGTAGFIGSTPVYLAAIACDGSLQILSRPGLSNALYAVVIDGELQTTVSCIYTCIDIPIEVTPVAGTTVAWAATAGAPASELGATSKASATVLVTDRDGLQCAGPGLSQTATRTQYELTCLLLDSPDDVPTDPLFPDAIGTSPPVPVPDPPVGGSDADDTTPEQGGGGDGGGGDGGDGGGGDGGDGGGGDGGDGGGGDGGDGGGGGGGGGDGGGGDSGVAEPPQTDTAMSWGAWGAKAVLLAAVVAMPLLL